MQSGQRTDVAERELSIQISLQHLFCHLDKEKGKQLTKVKQLDVIVLD